MSIRTLTPDARPHWDAFVTNHPDGTFFHKSGWQPVLEKSFGHATRYLYMEQDGAITGVLPLVHVKSLLFGSALISTAFCVYGGPLAVDAGVETALREAAVSEMERLRADRVEFRFRRPTGSTWLQAVGRYATFRRPIDPDPEKNLLAIPRKQRAVVRKSCSSGLTAECDTKVERLHRVYGESVRNLGSPVFPKRYFRALLDQFGDQAEILTVLDGGRPVASVLSFFFRDEVLPYYGGGIRSARASGANDFMYWQVMNRAAERGCRVFDFGRSKVGTGAYDFKKNWGFAPEPLVYEFSLRAGDSLPDTSPTNPRLQRYIDAWKRLPLPVANFVGPRLIRGLGLGA
jgi:FemAB-related protein (PEP-CTERM system-associated)